ncbi:MAG: hypothetical protein DRJ61_01060 [Acidobacteria bacterium]|nr:MAG: hypothetical protein DRJ61_01060 [Acidobacteriota bacterium]
MLLRTFLVVSLLFLPACKGQASTEEGPLRFSLTVHDVTVGEIPLGAGSLFQLIVENTSSEEIRLATGGNHWWMLHSPYWEVRIEGPITPECRYTDTTPGDGLLQGQVASVDIPANSTRQFRLALSGVCDPGEYRVSMKYCGTRVPYEVCHRKDVESEVAVFEIREAQGIDAEIIDLWRSQHPSKPQGLFPRGGMEPNIVNHDILLAHYPTSTYAGWVIRRMSPGARMRHWTVEEMFEDLHRPHLERTGRRGQGGHDSEGNFKWITPEEEAKKYIGLAEPFLSKHEDHILTPVISRRLALAHFVLHQWQEGYEAMKRSQARPWPTSCFSKSTWCLATEDGKEPHREMASEILDFLKQKGLVKDKEEKMEQR